MPLLQQHTSFAEILGRVASFSASCTESLGAFEKGESLNIHMYIYIYIYIYMPLLQKHACFAEILGALQPLLRKHWVLSRKGKVSTYIRTHIHIYIHASFAETCLFCRSIGACCFFFSLLYRIIGCFRERGKSQHTYVHIYIYMPLLQKHASFAKVLRALSLVQPLLQKRWVLSRKGKVSTYVCIYD